MIIHTCPMFWKINANDIIAIINPCCSFYLLSQITELIKFSIHICCVILSNIKQRYSISMLSVITEEIIRLQILLYYIGCLIVFKFIYRLTFKPNSKYLNLSQILKFYQNLLLYKMGYCLKCVNRHLSRLVSLINVVTIGNKE